MRRLAILALTCGMALPAAAAWGQCPDQPWTTYKGVALWPLGEGVYAYQTDRLDIDADGAPNAYGPGNKGIDDNRNAGLTIAGSPRLNNWRDMIVADPRDPSRPYVQTGGEHAGYFVSKTALRSSGAETDPATFVDSRVIPYVVFPGNFYKLSGTGHVGDVVFARNRATGRETEAIVADIGNKDDALGEISIALAERLGAGDVSPRTGATLAGKTVYVVFRGSGATPRWPRAQADIRDQAQKRLAAVGGWERALACVIR